MFWNPFQAFKQVVSPAYLGVDIGTTSVKITEVSGGKQLPRVVNYAILESQSSLVRTNAAFQASALKIFEEEIVELLKEALARMKPQTTEALASLPGFSAFTTVISLPKMGAPELKKAVMFQARQYVPLPLSEVALDWQKVGEYRDESGFTYEQVLLISVPQEQIKKYQRVFKGAGLALRALEIESVSLVRALVGGDLTPTIILDIGSHSSAMALVQEGQLKLTSQTDYAGASLTQALASTLKVSPLRAEELKRGEGLVGSGPNFELSTAMLPFLDVILSEVRRVEFSYATLFPSAPKFERLLLAGGGANLLGIERYAARQLGIPVVKAAPFSRFEYATELEPFLGGLNPLLSVALGLTLREF